MPRYAKLPIFNNPNYSLINTLLYLQSTHFDTVYSDQENCTNGDVRLVEGSGINEGRVEVCVNDAWGTICSINWDNKDRQVVCLQLGFQFSDK